MYLRKTKKKQSRLNKWIKLMKNKIEVEHIFISLTLKQNKNKNDEPESNKWLKSRRKRKREPSNLIIKLFITKKKDKEHGNERPRSFPEIWFLDVHTDDNVDDTTTIRFVYVL